MTAESPTQEHHLDTEVIGSLLQRIQLEIPNVPISEHDRNTEGKLLAIPDGQPSLLSEFDWKLVRTPTFKKWFGDWQTPSAEDTFSAVIDVNGEPLKVYHETTHDFTEFDDERIGSSTDSGYYGAGHYFSTNTGISGYYSGEEQVIILGFLNLRKPYYFDDEDGENLYLRYLLNRKNKATAIAETATYLGVERIRTQLAKLISGEIEKHRDIPFGIDFDEYWEQRRQEEIIYYQSLLAARENVIKNLPEIYEQVNQQYDGVICLKKGESISYDHYTEIVAFKSDQILVTDKRDNRSNRKF